jgi:anti-sigma factor RsiW
MESYESTTRRMRPEQPGLCALIQDTLPFFLEGDLSPQSRPFVEQHLEECERCAAFLAGGRSVQAHFRREATMRSGVMHHDQRGQELVARGQRRMLGLLLIVAGALAFAMVAAGLLLGHLPIGQHSAATIQVLQPTIVPPAQEQVFVPTVAPWEHQPTASPIPVVVPAP